jgi:ascorbate-specific PTS system EIIC-type component UlaA
LDLLKEIIKHLISNAGPHNLTSQLAIIYNALESALVIQSSGYVSMAYGYGQASDERIKTNIKTIENHKINFYYYVVLNIMILELNQKEKE